MARCDTQMTRTTWTTRLLVPAVILTCSIAGNSQQGKQNAPKIPTVGYCELASHPEKYIGKLVRTEASYIVWWESSYLYSRSCLDSDHKIHNSMDCDAEDQECRERFFSEWKKLDPYMRSQPDSDVQRVKAVFIGRLVGPNGYGHLNGFRYEFRIKAVERASAIPKKVSWKGL